MKKEYIAPEILVVDLGAESLILTEMTASAILTDMGVESVEGLG